MKLSLGGDKSPEQKKNMIVGGVAIVVILVAVFMVGRNFIGGGQTAPSPSPAGGPITMVDPMEQQQAGVRQPSAPGQPGQPAPAPGAQPTAPAPAAPPPQPSAPAPAPAAQPSGPPAAAPASPPPAARPAAAPAKPKPVVLDKNNMRQIKVFGVAFSYPAKWKINIGAGNRSAQFTNGPASFYVHAPDPKATSAKTIAQSALKSLAPGAAVTAQGADRVGGSEAYWIAVTSGGKSGRVIGVDGPTRLALYEVVKGGNYASYKTTFDMMRAAIRF